jgi:hypothetical protein
VDSDVNLLARMSSRALRLDWKNIWFYVVKA